MSDQLLPASIQLSVMLCSTLFLTVSCVLITSAGSQKLHVVACEGSVAQLKCGEITGFVGSASNWSYYLWNDPESTQLQFLQLGTRDQENGEVISVTSATYGRRDQQTCTAGRPANQITNVQCSRSSDSVGQSCNGKQSCSITAANSVFGDPCVGTYKYLEVEYKCEYPERKPQSGPTVACEGSVAQLQCDGGKVISVTSATYGRRDQQTCTAGRPANQITNVQCSRSSDSVGQSCNGKQSCSITAANSVFGDPCVGTYKYLEVEYTCQNPEKKPQSGPTVACEGSVAQLQCDKGEVISVTSATYGRRDQKTCTAGRPADQITNVQCSRSSDSVGQRCNGKQLCNVEASNSMFGDPCVGTYKYLEVDYICYAFLTG